jgi:hypothetical protein
MVGDHRRLDSALGEQPEQPQRDIEHDLDVHPRVVGHPEPVGEHLLHVPQALDVVVAVGGIEQRLQLAVAAARRVNGRALDRVARPQRPARRRRDGLGLVPTHRCRA